MQEQNIELNYTARSILIVGDTIGMFGYYRTDYIDDVEQVVIDDTRTNIYRVAERLQYLSDKMYDGTKIYIVGNSKVCDYYNDLFMFLLESKRFKKSMLKKQDILYTTSKDINTDSDILDVLSGLDMVFDYIILSPTYTMKEQVLKRCTQLLNKNNGLMQISDTGINEVCISSLKTNIC